MSRKSLKLLIVALISIYFTPWHQVSGQSISETYYPVQLSLGTVSSAKWQPAGEMIAVAGSQGVRLYTDEFTFIKQITSENTQSVYWDPTGTKLVSVSQGRLTLWDVTSGTAEFTIDNVGCPVEFSPNGSLLALGGPDGQIRIVSTQNGSSVTTYEGQRVPNDEIDSSLTNPEFIMWNVDSSGIISAGGKPHQIHAWNAQTGQFVSEIMLDGFLHYLSCAGWIAQSPDRHKVFNINTTGNVSASIWEIQSGSLLASTEQTPPLADFLKVTWNPDGTKLAALDLEAQALTIWDAEDLSVLNTFTLLPPSPDPTFASGGSELNASLDWSADGTKILIGTIGGATIFDAQTGVQINRLQGYTGWANAVAWSPNGNYLATAHGSLDGYGDNSIRIWDTVSSSSIATCSGHSGSVNDVAWNLDGSSLATVAGNGNSSDGTVRTWDFPTCQELDGAWLRSLSANQVSWKPNGSELFATSTVVVIYTSNFSQLAEIGVYSSAAEWSPDGQKLAVGLVNDPSGASLLIYETTNYTLLSTITGYSDQITKIEWSPDGSKVATIDHSDNSITITDLSSGNLTTLTGHSAPVTAISWNSQENLLASAGADNTIRIWDMASRNEVAVLENQEAITDLAWSPDGTKLASSSYTGAITIWKPVPKNPSDLSAQVLNTAQIQLTWTDNSDDENSFSIERSDDVNGWMEIDVVDANTTSYTDTDALLSPSTTYYYRVRAYRDSDYFYSEFSNTTSVSTASAPPSNLAIEADPSGKVDLSWEDNSSDETSFSIERSPDGSTNWVVIDTVPAATVDYEDTGLTRSTTYWYRVRAHRESDNQFSDYTLSVSVLTSPSDPSQATATLSAPNQIQINWTDDSTDESEFRIERSITGTSGWSEIGTATSATYTDSTVNPSTTYYYRVRAYRSSDNQYSSYSNVANVLTTSAAPSNLAGVAIPTGKVNLSWQDNSSDETTFRIERSPNGSTGWVEIGHVDSNITAYQDTGLNASTTYYYRVRAFRSGDAQYSAYTEPKNVLTAPAGVSQVTATLAAPYQIQVGWTDDSADETDFRIERSLNGTSGWSEVGSAVANATSYTDSSVNPSTTYYYRVRAYRSDNVYSVYSSVSSGVLTASAAPTGFAGVPLPINKAKLIWTDSSTDETNFRLERSDNGTSGWTEIIVAANQATYTETRTNCIQTSYYRIRAYRGSDNQYSAYSPVVSVTTDGCGPDRLALFNTVHTHNRRFTNFEGTTYNDYWLNAPLAAGLWVMGDWDGNGVDTPAVFNQDSNVFAFTNDTGATGTWVSITLTVDGVPVAGRFNGNRANDCLGVVDDIPWGSDTAFALWFACDFTNLAPNIAELGYQWLGTPLANSAGYSSYGVHQFVAGDFNTDGVDTIAARRGTTVVYGNTPPTTQLAAIDLAQYFGNPYNGQYSGLYGALVAGDWNYDGVDTFGYFYEDGNFYWRNHLDWNQPISGSALIPHLYGTYVLPTTWRN